MILDQRTIDGIISLVETTLDQKMIEGSGRYFEKKMVWRTRAHEGGGVKIDETRDWLKKDVAHNQLAARRPSVYVATGRSKPQYPNAPHPRLCLALSS